MREKIVAAIFVVGIALIPLLTIGQRIFGDAKEQPVITEEGSIAELNREEQLLMQQALAEQAQQELASAQAQEETTSLPNDAEETMTSTEGENEVQETVELAPGVGSEQSTQEDDANGGGFFDTLIQSVEDFTGDLALQQEAASANSALTSALADDAYIDSDQVLAGKGGWLFYKRSDDGTSLQDYQGTSTFSDMEKIKKQLVQTRDAMAAKGARFVVMIVPNKELIYSEYMPSTVHRSSEITRCDKLYEYLTKNSDLEVVYPKKQLLAAKNTCQVYYKYDTHWNYAGVYVGIQCLLQRLYGTYVDIKDANLVVESHSQSGDLAALVGLQNKYCDDDFYNFYASAINPAQMTSDRVLIVGDSFGDMMTSMMGYYFSKVDMVGVWTFKMSMLDSYKPNVVVWECAERYGDRLSWINLSTKTDD